MTYCTASPSQVVTGAANLLGQPHPPKMSDVSTKSLTLESFSLNVGSVSCTYGHMIRSYFVRIIYIITFHCTRPGILALYNRFLQALDPAFVQTSRLEYPIDRHLNSVMFTSQAVAAAGDETESSTSASLALSLSAPAVLWPLAPR